VQSLVQQAEGCFAVGTMNFPLPTTDDPQYGRFVEGPLFESLSSGFPFGITRTSQYPELARDFMLYLMSRDANEKMNKIIGWIPAIRDTQVAPILEPFLPNLEGVTAGFNGNTFNLGGETWIRWMQLYSLFQVKKASFDEIATEFMKFYRTRGQIDFKEQQRDWQRSLKAGERFLAGLRMKVLQAVDPADRHTQEIKYANQVMGRQILSEYTWRREAAILADPQKSAEFGAAAGPYEYHTLAVDNLRQQARTGFATEPAAGQPNS
jgi:hypothetical protein